MSTETATQSQQKFGLSNDIEPPRGETKATLTFFAPPADGAQPYNYAGAYQKNPPSGMPQRNYGQDAQEVTIRDIRGRESEFDMNESGFGVVQNISSVMRNADFNSDEKIEKAYYPEIEKLILENVPGAERVFIFDHTVRRSDPNAHRAPVRQAHIDQTTKSANARVDHHMGSEAEALKNGRVRLINVWRPLNGPVLASPLAYADSRSVPDEDIVPIEHRYPDRKGEIAGVKYTRKGEWYFWSGMRNDERILLQCYDSKDGARTPHSAFTHPDTKPEWPGRESIEVRTLVFG
ncbi:uncharacterized protein MYCFIDRAFT_211221 [Pseudocercospora fijiensis CIRAD86]|uniref:Methyltransferase n=1 Tax=Pseudocercospora fijiensis (strain CIRAD86) TaxID=383855 RepID=M3B0Q5_PSEFD|nr:uncharacterized protein MYCFIDRAFT_211221 [Pseudocercospora fijiensis CIRAD86]EME83022.1 hypothetical protein MYCFIDRAFT_211221 [Pseudocercospora fijiensis CIRAD86]